MDPTARQVCLHSGGDAFMEGVDVTSILQTLKHYFLPDATDQVFQDVQRFLHYKRTDQPMERFILDFDVLRRKAERRIQTGFQFPDPFVSILCMTNACLSRQEMSLVIAAVQGSLDYPAIALQMRQILNPVGKHNKEDILSIAMEEPPLEDLDLSYEAWVAYRKAGKGKNPASTGPKKSKGKGNKSEELSRNGFNRRTGERLRCYGCGSEFHLLPKCPKRNSTPQVSVAPPPPPSTVPRSSFSSIALDPEPPACLDSVSPETGTAGHCEQSFSTTLDTGCQLVCMQDDSVVILDTGATANLVCLRWLNHHNALLEQKGMSRVSPYPAQARFKFGDGRI